MKNFILIESTVDIRIRIRIRGCQNSHIRIRIRGCGKSDIRPITNYIVDIIASSFLLVTSRCVRHRVEFQ